MSINFLPLTLNINGQQYGPMDVPEGLMMIDFLHEYVDLTGSRLGCGQGICHACVVILDNPSGTSEEIRTCITGAHFFNNKKFARLKVQLPKKKMVKLSYLPFNKHLSNTLAFNVVTAPPAL